MASPTIPDFDATGCKICEQCNKRYVKPSDKFQRGRKKGQIQEKCKVCRRDTKKDDFPKHLIVPDSLIRKRKDNISQQAQNAHVLGETRTPEQLWLASLTCEEESILVHGQTALKRFSSDATLSDLPHATSNVHWQDVLNRLRDIYDLSRLVKDCAALQQEYVTEVNTVAPIGLLAVSLNNFAVHNKLPFKFCWLNLPLQDGKAVIMMSLDARSPPDTTWWTNASPTQRLKACSCWETNIRKSARAITIPYHTTEKCTYRVDGKTDILLRDRHSLLWVHDTFVNKVRYPGTLHFPDGQMVVPKDQIRSINELLTLLVDHFHQHKSKQAWSDIQQRALQHLHKHRAPSSQAREACERLIMDKRNTLVTSDDTLENDRD